jgi:hypothetical protein
MSNRIYALYGRNGDAGGRYLRNQWPQMRVAAWRMACAGEMVQVWRAMQNGDLLRYDGNATRRISDYIVKGRAALAKVQS